MKVSQSQYRFIVAGIVAVMFLPGCSRKMQTGVYMLDKTKSKFFWPSPGTIPSMSITLKDSEIFEIKPFRVGGRWRESGGEIFLEPSEHLALFEMLETGNPDQKSTPTPLRLAIKTSRELEWVPSGQKRGQQFRMVFVRQ